MARSSNSERALSAEDRGWLVGDAVFETVLVDRGVPAFLDSHLARLAVGLNAMRIAASVETQVIERVIFELAEKNGVSERGAFRLTVSRVGGARGLAPSQASRPQVAATLTAIGPAPAGWRAVIAAPRRWTGSSTTGFKCAGAYAENMLAKMEAVDAEVDEAVMLNEHGRVACASAANIFLAFDDCLKTPPPSEGAMPGIVRAVVIEEARRLSLTVIEEPIPAAALGSSSLLFTNSIAGTVRTALHGAQPMVGAGVADRIIEAYRVRLDADLAAARERSTT